ncbi:MAG: tyrosine-type recombinase/integrase [Haloferacaceae archaeon]
MTDDLDPLAPSAAVNLYLDHREPDVSEKTLQNQRYRLNRFLEWCEVEGIENMNALSGRDLHRYRTWRSQQVNAVTLRGELATLRVFLEFCASIDAVEPGLRERVLLPDVAADEEAKDEELPDERAHRILSHLEKFRYASREHVIMAILWHTGIRLGSLRAFDLNDWDPDEMCLSLRHRPDTETPLKNGAAAERVVAVSEHYAEVLEDYIEYNRHSVTDEHGREPLLTSSQGRLSGTAIRNIVYRVTRPCLIRECPHDRDPETCEAMEPEQASHCPSSRSPHTIRRGSITYQLREQVPQRVVEERANVSDEVLEQHYDERTEREKMRVRRDFIDDLEANK